MSLKEKIKKSGFKQKHIADKLGISQATLSYYVTGTRSTPKEIQEQIDKFFKIFSNGVG